ncbi:hypothetical protein CPB86DRAFT_797921 [Serendipita vermifera]|nr:hypothetical protein CPB86DRAFT_797921 [Serendipita vermifera]
MPIKLGDDATKLSLEEYLANLKGLTDQTVSNASKLPQDIPFHRSLHRKFRTDLDTASERVLQLTNKLLKLSSTLNKKKATTSQGRKARRDDDNEPSLNDEDDIMDRFHSIVVDVLDPLLEHTDKCLDIHTGRLKLAPKINVVGEADKRSEVPTTGRLPQHIMHASNLPKPQLGFLDPVNNDNSVVWDHQLRTKWHTLDVGSDTLSKEGILDIVSTHPYVQEITSLTYPPSVLTSRAPIPMKSFEDTPFTFINTAEGLSSLLEKLRQSEEIAIDLEHHSYRSYYGFGCLMQISTRLEDFVVDTLVPEVRARMEDFNEVFTDPKILKVLHGAESDIVWLQENFNLYIVNMFDTFHASRALDLPRHSLAFLLSVYCDFTADKRYQLADWRIRPLPAEMLHYARSDTHFLLFIYDNLREALLERGRSHHDAMMDVDQTSEVVDEARFVKDVLKKSQETALREHVRESYDEKEGEGKKGWAFLIRKWNKRSLAVDGIPRRTFLAVHRWRDQVAREEDESPVYVLSNNALLDLVERPVPNDLMALYSSFPGAVPPLIRRRGQELLDLMKKTEEDAKLVIRRDAKVSDEDIMVTEKEISQGPTHVKFAQKATPVPNLWEQFISVKIPRDVTAAVSMSKRSSLFAPASALFGTLAANSAPSNSSTLSNIQNAPRLSSTTSSLFSRLDGSNSASSGALSRIKADPTSTKKRIDKIHEQILSRERQAVRVQQQPSKKIQRVVQETVTAIPKPVVTTIATASTSTVKPQAQKVTEAVEIKQAAVSVSLPLDDVVAVRRKDKKRKYVDGDASEDKRKKTKISGDQAGGKINDTGEPEMFDYSTAPNILDEGMGAVDEVREGMKSAKARKRGGKEVTVERGD